MGLLNKIKSSFKKEKSNSYMGLSKDEYNLLIMCKKYITLAETSITDRNYDLAQDYSEKAKDTLTEAINMKGALQKTLQTISEINSGELNTDLAKEITDICVKNSLIEQRIDSIKSITRV